MACAAHLHVTQIFQWIDLKPRERRLRVHIGVGTDAVDAESFAFEFLDAGDFLPADYGADHGVLALTDDHQILGAAKNSPYRSKAANDADVRLAGENRRRSDGSRAYINQANVGSVFLEKAGLIGDPHRRHGNYMGGVECRDGRGLRVNRLDGGDASGEANANHCGQFAASDHREPPYERGFQVTDSGKRG